MIVDERRHEQEKYLRAFAIPTYAMGPQRKDDARRNLRMLPTRGSYLDVGCGRGEMVDYAKTIGFSPTLGVDIVPALIDGERVIYGEGHALPVADKSWDVVTLFDVIEHLLPGDDEAVCRELARVARRHILLTANNKESRLPDGTELHINRRPHEEWECLFQAWFAPATMFHAPGRITYVVSPMWRIDL